MNRPIVWTIAGSDSSGGAGIQSDLLTFHHLNVHACTIITAATAQNANTVAAINPLSLEQIKTQLYALHDSFYPAAIKIGMLGSEESILLLEQYFLSYSGKIVLDPVMTSSTGIHLYNIDHKQYLKKLKMLFPYVDLLTPNLPEAEAILNCKIQSYEDIKNAASELLALGIKSVIIKAGHFAKNEYCHDYWSDGHDSFWLSSKRQLQKNYRGSGCMFSSAVTASLASGHSLKDALVIAKMMVSQGIRLARHQDDKTAYLYHSSLPDHAEDFPWLSSAPLDNTPCVFNSCGDQPLGLYPVVDSSDWLKRLLPLGVSTIQLRIKDKEAAALENEIKTAIAMARQYNARLFINDHWELAITHGAYGVHLGQEDLNAADIKKIQTARLRLGISTHCYYEVARALAYRPSYLACGPIFATNSKEIHFAPQGIEQLHYWRRALHHYPIVAIGGINSGNMADVLKTGVDGIAMISAITQAKHPEQATRELLNRIESYSHDIIS